MFQKLSHEPKLWTFLHMLSKTLQQLSIDVKVDLNLAKSLLKARPLRIHISKQNINHELHESLHYIFDAVLPFLAV